MSSRSRSYVTYIIPAPYKPWIISTPGELSEDAPKTSAFSNAWLKSHPFPGIKATLETKSNWLKTIHDLYQAELEERYYTFAPKGCDVVKDELLKRSPDTLTVQIGVDRTEFGRVELDEEEEANFAGATTNLSKFLVKGYKGDVKFASYQKWLLDRTTDDQKTHVVIAEIQCPKDSSMEDTIHDFCETFGLSGNFVLSDGEYIKPKCYSWDIQEIVGENMYYPQTIDGINTRATTSKLVVPLTLNLTDKDNSSDGKNSKVFMKAIKNAEKSTKNTSNQKTYIIIPKNFDDDDDSNDDDPPPSATTHFVLWLPAAYRQHHDRVSNHFLRSEGEAMSIKHRLDRGGRDTCNLKAEMFQRHLAHAKSFRRDVKEKLCAALALTKVASEIYECWLQDGEYPEDVIEDLGTLAKLWRTVLLTKSDEDLGITAPEGLGAMYGGDGGSREGLYAFLDILGREFVRAADGARFNWRPGKPRKRRKTKK